MCKEKKVANSRKPPFRGLNSEVEAKRNTRDMGKGKKKSKKSEKSEPKDQSKPNGKVWTKPNYRPISEDEILNSRGEIDECMCSSFACAM